MGNTVAAPTVGNPVLSSRTKARAVYEISEAESDRLFREKIGYISVIQKAHSNNSGSSGAASGINKNSQHSHSHRNTGDGLALFPGDLVSAVTTFTDLSSRQSGSKTTNTGSKTTGTGSKTTNTESKTTGNTRTTRNLSSREGDTGGGSGGTGMSTPQVREIAIRGGTRSTMSPTHSSSSSLSSKEGQGSFGIASINLPSKGSSSKTPSMAASGSTSKGTAKESLGSSRGTAKESVGTSKGTAKDSFSTRGTDISQSAKSKDNAGREGVAKEIVAYAGTIQGGISQIGVSKDSTTSKGGKSKTSSNAKSMASFGASNGARSKESNSVSTEGSALWGMMRQTSDRESIPSKASQKSRVSKASLAAASVRQRSQASGVAAAAKPVVSRFDSVTSITSIPSQFIQSSSTSSFPTLAVQLPAEQTQLQQQIEAQDTETQILLKAMKRKMEQADLERDSCLSQIETLNKEMEAFREDTTKMLEEKNDTIELHETDMACLKQQILVLQTQNKDDKNAAMTETRGLLRKVTTLQNTLMVVEKERDAAVAAMDAVPSEHGSTASPDAGELKETIQDLLQQLETAEEDHQREQNVLQEDVLLLRRKLERLESDFIVVERERDDAVHRLEQSAHTLEEERVINASDIKKYQDELQRWKDRYVQELRFSNKETGQMLQKTAVILGNRLSAGILEGIQEEDNEDDENLEPSSSSGPTSTSTPSSIEDRHETYHRLLARLQSVSPSPIPSLTDVSSSAVPTSIASSSDSGPVWIPSGHRGHHQPMSEVSFDENISIPSFLSKIW
ncbi:expressed unknown protein [Seminavis robusta]|uniref:Uncharacterized protein n=1 Tax=Seminavis robusta TaxID=568900 RepID=A0A9N8HF38_9STRA|nr:expressed unknown protein [Seminavis robusta]|eukprot:Sro506_g156300.1 n/a (791) ;mRNA; f:22111-24483